MIPREVAVPRGALNCRDDASILEIEYAIGEYLSYTYGYCTNSFNYNEEDLNSHAEFIHVFDIDWDLGE